MIDARPSDPRQRAAGASACTSPRPGPPSQGTRCQARGRAGSWCLSRPRRWAVGGTARSPRRRDRVTAATCCRLRARATPGFCARARRRTPYACRQDGRWTHRSRRTRAHAAARETGGPGTPCSPSTRRDTAPRSWRGSSNTQAHAPPSPARGGSASASARQPLARSTGFPRSSCGASAPMPRRSFQASGPPRRIPRSRRPRAMIRMPQLMLTRMRGKTPHPRRRTRSQPPFLRRSESLARSPPAGRVAARRSQPPCRRERTPAPSPARYPRSLR